MLMVAVVVSIAASVYLYREFQKQTQDISNLRTYSLNLSKQLTHTLPRDTVKQVKARVKPVPTPEPEPELVTEDDEETEE
jgi:hypothetical protein